MYNEKTNTFPVFINYDKAPDISDTIKYEDRFVSDCELIGISKKRRTLASKEDVYKRQTLPFGCECSVDVGVRS